MRLFLVQFIKDFRSNFVNFNAYIILGAYYLLSLFSAIYLGDYFLRESDIMNSFFVMQPIILIFIIPTITMRSWAEEIKTGTIEILFTQPISYFTLVVAKFFASFSFFMLLILSSFLLYVFSYWLSVLDIGIVLSGYLGLILCGALFTAIGCSVSIFCKNNILSYVVTTFILFFITQLDFSYIDNISLKSLGFENNYVAFMSGILTINNVVYFVLLTIIFIWINLLGIYFRKITSKIEKVIFYAIIFIFALIFFSTNIGISNCFDVQFDITDEKRLTLSDKTNDILKNIDNRIDVTLYEAKKSREDANSSYAIFAEFVEKTLHLIEKKSNGSIRINITMVEPFSDLERRLIKNGINFTEDTLGYKKYLAVEFFDNEGNHAFIKSLNSMRQNLLESDIMRVLKTFGLAKKKIGVFAHANDGLQFIHFEKMLEEFYNPIYFTEIPPFIDNSFDTVIVIAPQNLSTDNFLSLEQYILNGGNVIIFAEKSILQSNFNASFVKFLQNYGIYPNTREDIFFNIDNNKLFIGPSLPTFENTSQDIRSVIVNEVGGLDISSNKNYTVSSLLSFSEKVIAAISEGYYVSMYLNLVEQFDEILPVSKKTGKLAFVYDTDLLSSYVSILDEGNFDSFYEMIPSSDNLLFLMRLVSYVSNSNIEENIKYRHYVLNYKSIGNVISSQIRKKYEDKLKSLKETLEINQNKKERFYEVLGVKKFASIKNIGDLSQIEQVIDETENEINKYNALIGNEYQNMILVLTIILIFVFPLIYIVLLFGILTIYKNYKHKVIRRLCNDDKAS